MPTTSIGNHGYSVLKEELTSTEITKHVVTSTVKPFTNTLTMEMRLPFSGVFRKQKKVISSQFYGIKEFGPPESVKIDPGEDAPELHREIKRQTVTSVKAFQDATLDRETGGGIISVPCGYGKTVLALYLAAQMGKKTL